MSFRPHRQEVLIVVRTAIASRRQRRAEHTRCQADRFMTRNGAHAVVRHHERQDNRGVTAPRGFRPGAEEQARHHDDDEIDIDDRHQVGRKPVPVERTEEARPVRRRKVHQDVTDDADHRRRQQQAERRFEIVRRPRTSPVDDALTRADEQRDQRAERQNANQPVRRSPMPLQVRRRPARGHKDVDVRRVRRQRQRRRRAAACAPEGRARQRQGKKGMREVVHPVGNIPACFEGSRLRSRLSR